MKKLFCLSMAVLLILGLCACGTTESVPTTTQFPDSNLQIGFARMNITPAVSVPLAGYGAAEKRMSTGVADDLFLHCLAMSDGETTALLFCQDLLNTTAVLVPKIRAAINAEVPVLGDHIFVAATATYSGPDMKSTHKNIESYTEQYLAAFVTCAKDALADMAPTAMVCGSTVVEDLSFIHHYTMEDGTVEDGYYGFFDRAITGHAAEPDRNMRMVRARREEKPDILILNWQCRPTLNGAEDKSQISADFVGHLRNKVEADTGMHCVYFSGSLGDISPTSRIEQENHGLDAKAYGEKVAEYAVNALDTLTPLEGNTTVGVYKGNYNCPVNHEDEDKLELAKQVVAERKQNGDLAADKLAKELGLRSVYHAASITARPGRKERDDFEVSALRLGELGFLMSPGQMSSASGEKTLAEIPTKFAIMVGQANARWYTIPSEAAFDYGGYEADTSYFARGAGERMGELMNEMLLMTIPN